MNTVFSLQRFRFLPRAERPACNKGNVIRGGFESTFRLSACDAQAGRIVCHATGIRQEATGNSKTTEPLWFSMDIHPSCRKGRRSSAGNWEHVRERVREGENPRWSRRVASWGACRTAKENVVREIRRGSVRHGLYSRPTLERCRTRGRERARSKKGPSAVISGQSSSAASARKEAS